MALTGLCITLYNCETGEIIHYETNNTGLAQTVVSTVGLGNVAQINDPTNFPNTYYTIADCIVTGKQIGRAHV